MYDKFTTDLVRLEQYIDFRPQKIVLPKIALPKIALPDLDIYFGQTFLQTICNLIMTKDLH